MNAIMYLVKTGCQWRMLPKDFPPYNTVFYYFKILNEGEHIMPTPGRFEGEHFVSVTPGQWTHIIWELPDMYRDKVTGFTCNIMMNGETPAPSSEMHLYLDDMRLEKVEAENSRGFDLRKGAIAFSHNGYRIGTRKQAVAQNVSSKAFRVVNDVTGRTAFKGEGVESEKGFVTMDFSSLEKQGRRICPWHNGGAGDRPSQRLEPSCKRLFL